MTSPSTVRGDERRGSVILASVVFLVAVAWNSWRLSTPSMWADEISTTQNTAEGFAGIVDVVRRIDAVMAPYYVGIEAWTSVFGTSDAAFRFPSVLAMGVAASATVLLARKYVDTVGAVLAGVLVIAAPAMTRYAQEARVYAFVVAAVVLSTLLLHEAAERRNRRWWSAYAVVLASVGVGHLVGLMIVAAHVLFAIGRGVRASTLIAACAPAVIIGSALAVIGHTQSAAIDWIPKGGPARLQYAEMILLGGKFAAVLIVVSCAAFALWTLTDPTRRRTDAWLLVPLVAPLLLWLVGHVTHIFSSRYVVWVVPFHVLAAVVVWRRAGKPFAAVASIVLMVTWIPLQLDVRSPDGHLVAYRDAARFLDETVKDGDVVRSAEVATQLSVDRYSSRLRAETCSATGAVTWELVRSDRVDISKTCFPDLEPTSTVKFRGLWIAVYESAAG
ncbi:glycosyltransferase family 39 protein [Rhodococcoides corynebacterioides]|uniref:glycosyltransferase family 39 protein n=1 Tax=Rhodococcoides corynebacterioides TaxID=53972 RepID=UPI003AD8561C